MAMDDGIFPKIVHPPVTVGVQPLREIAEGACELLKKKMENEERGSYAKVIRPREKW